MNSLKRLFPFFGACAATAVLALLIAVYFLTKPVPMTGIKNISIEVTDESNDSNYYRITTEAQFLMDALETIPELEIEGISGEDEGEFFVTSINGKTADYEKDGTFWELFCDGEPCTYDPGRQAIQDGEHYTFQYTYSLEDKESSSIIRK